MKRVLIPASLIAAGIVAAAVHAGVDPGIISPIGAAPSSESFKQFNDIFTGEWQQYGEVFTNWQSSLFSRIFLGILTVVPVLFFLHYIVFGAKHFDHSGPGVFYFSVFTRSIHWLAAVSFILLVLTGLLVIFGKFLGGGTLIMSGRSVHIGAALVFTGTAVCMFLIWIKDMLPMPHDIKWMLIMGGYLSKTKKPIPSGKFNAGQKSWFWLATAGGGIMAYSGWYLYSFQAMTDQLRIMSILHSSLAAALVAFFIIHLYMSLFAIKGSVTSMITGYKPREEVEILHSRYKIPDNG